MGQLARAQLDAFTLRFDSTLAWQVDLALAGVHALGFVGLARLFHLSWTFALVLSLLLIGGCVLLRLGARVSATWLGPYFIVYLLVVVRYAFVHLLHGTLGGYFDYLLPDWQRPLLAVDAAILAATLYSSFMLLASWLGDSRRAIMAGLGLMGLCVLAWSGVRYFGQRTSGTTGSDPYAYVQMGVDLATRGTPAHEFALIPGIAPLGLPWYPVLHTGYHLPFDAAGDAISVWPPGGAVAYALAFVLDGEGGMYLVNPFFSLLSVLVTGLAAYELTRGHSKELRVATGCIAMALLATANEQAVWSGVTMVDAQAELLTVTAVYSALCSRVSRGLLRPFLAGVALGAAFDVRHTQLVLAPSLLIILWSNRQRDAGRVAVCAAGALVLALPDLWYHQLYLGAWFRPESEELALFSLSNVPQTVARLSAELFAAREFGWMVPFLLAGIALFARRRRRIFLALALWTGLGLALHLPYTALRLRDLLPEFPAVAFICAYGMIAPVRWLGRGQEPAKQLAAGVVVLLALELFLLRVWNTVPGAWQLAPPAFGSVNTAQRAAFAELERAVPEQALVGSALNDGAIDLLSHRLAFRPADWDRQQLGKFVNWAEAQGRRVYILDDGAAIDRLLPGLEQDYALRPVSRLDIPLAGDGPVRFPGALWAVEKR